MVAVGIILKCSFGFGQRVHCNSRRVLCRREFWALWPGRADAEPLLELRESFRPWRSFGFGGHGANAAPLAATSAVQVLCSTYGERLVSGLVKAVAIIKILRRRWRGTFLQSLFNFFNAAEHGWGLLACRDCAEENPRGLCHRSPLLESYRSFSIRYMLIFLSLRVGALGKCCAHPPHSLKVKGFLAAGWGQQAWATFAPTSRPLLQAKAHPRQSRIPTLPFWDLFEYSNRWGASPFMTEWKRALVPKLVCRSYWKSTPAEGSRIQSIPHSGGLLWLVLLLILVIATWWVMDGKPLVQTVNTPRFGEPALAFKVSGEWGATSQAGSLTAPVLLGPEFSVSFSVPSLLTGVLTATEVRGTWLLSSGKNWRWGHRLTPETKVNQRKESENVQ